MDVRQIAYFMSVYEERSFTKASKKTNVVQPALSMQIRKLENELAVRLFTRTARGTMPTAAGEKLYARFRTISEDIAAAKRDIHEITNGDGLRGKVRIGLPPSVNRGVLATTLTQYIERYPLIDVTISEAFSGTLPDWLAEEKIDFAVGLRPPMDSNLVFRPLFSDCVALMCRDPLNGPTLTPCYLDRMPNLKLVLPSCKHSYGAAVRSWITESKVAPQRLMEIDGLVGCFEMARNSDWGVLCPSVALHNELQKSELYIYPVVRPKLQFNLHLMYDQRRPLNAAAEEFIKILEKELVRAKTTWSRLTSDVKHCAQAQNGSAAGSPGF
jgi:DNA-binding transcriptional LysR family regulator